MKTFTICLPDVEAAMLAELKVRKKEYRNLQQMIARMIVDDYKLLVLDSMVCFVLIMNQNRAVFS